VDAWIGLLALANPAFSQSWTRTSAPSKGWFSVASSADGGKSVAVVWDGGVYTSQITGKHLLDLGGVGGNLAVSWMVPSANFALQRSSDLTTSTWTDMPTPPILDLTNPQNQVAVPLPNGNQFYRLKAL
jgi:hypothetical protein